MPSKVLSTVFLIITLALGIVSLYSFFPKVLGSASQNDALSPLWSRTLGGDNDDFGNDIAINSIGNIYITGWKAQPYPPFPDQYIDNALLAKFDDSGKRLWNTTFGWGSDINYGFGVAIDSTGAVYTCGYSNYNNIAFLAKFDNSGIQLWNVTWNYFYLTLATNLAIDATGNIYVSGITTEITNSTSLTSLYLAKFDTSGTQLWNVTWPYLSTGNRLAIDSLGNIYIAGVYLEGSNIDALLVKFNNSGILLWNVTWGGNNWDQGSGVAIDSIGDIYMTGFTESFGNGGKDTFLAKYNNAGTQLWNVTWGGSGDDSGSEVALDSAGDVYITGFTNSTGTNNVDTLLLKYDNSGNLLWHAMWGGAGVDSGSALVVDSAETVYITGCTNSYSAGDYDVFIVMFGISPPPSIPFYSGLLILGSVDFLILLSLIALIIIKKIRTNHIKNL